MPDLSCLAETDYELINLKKTQLKQMDAEVTLSTCQTGSLQEDYIAILDKGCRHSIRNMVVKMSISKKKNRSLALT